MGWIQKGNRLSKNCGKWGWPKLWGSPTQIQVGVCIVKPSHPPVSIAACEEDAFAMGHDPFYADPLVSRPRNRRLNTAHQRMPSDR